MTAPHLILLLDAPLMAFGAPQIDQHGRTALFPGRSQLAGLIGNALGWRHHDTDRLQALQERMGVAGVILHDGEVLRDFQTLDLGQPFLDGCGWTTRGIPEKREGGSAATGTHIRYRWFQADAVVLVAVGLAPAGNDPHQPDVIAVAGALERPARPLFIGRKSCLPALPPLAGVVEAVDPLAALIAGIALPPVVERRRDMAESGGDRDVRLLTEWPATVPIPDSLAAVKPVGGPAGGYDEDRVFDHRDWANQLHGGTRRVRRLRLSGWPPVPEPVPAPAREEGVPT